MIFCKDSVVYQDLFSALSTCEHYGLEKGTLKKPIHPKNTTNETPAKFQKNQKFKTKTTKTVAKKKCNGIYDM